MSEITLHKIKKYDLYYSKPDYHILGDTYLKLRLHNYLGWIYILKFENRKEWFNFVKIINKANKEFKKMKNIEKENK